MKYNEALITRLAKVSKDGNVTEIAKKYCSAVGIEYHENVRKRISKIMKDTGIKGGSHLKVDETVEYQRAQKKKVKKQKRYIITYAQAHTPIDKGVWKGMNKLSERISAEIIVIPGTYQNPHSKYPFEKGTWVKDLIPYLHAREDKLHPYLSLVSDANVLPTAERPLRGFEGVTGEESSIVGHPRHHVEVVPTLPTSKEKFMMTTGAITLPNYRRARVGKKAEFHHIVGFLVVEIIDKENFTFRQVSSTKDGKFQDLNFVWDGKDLREDGKWESVILGDLHLGKHDEEMLSETERLMEIMQPKDVIIHDLSDGESVNPHAKNDFVHQVVQMKKGRHLVEEELSEMFTWLDQWKKWNLVVVPSNHNDWLDRWVRHRSGKDDIANAELYNALQSVLFRELAPKGLIAFLIDDRFKGEVKTLHRNSSYKRCGHELNNHGDVGANGSRGGSNIYKKLNVKIVSGHSHALYTLDGAYGVGISTHKDHGYNVGLSSWTKSHGAINELGKFQHLIYSGKKFTALL